MSQRSRSKRGTTSGEEKWKTKLWFKIKTPSYIDDKVIGTTPANDPEQVIGRTVYASMTDITGDFKDMNVLLKFKITKIEGEFAKTQFYGYILSRDYIRAQVRNRVSTIEVIENVDLKDGARVRVKMLCITQNRANSSQKKALTHHMLKRIHEFIEERTYPAFVTSLINKEFKNYVSEDASKIFPLRLMDLAKIKVLKLPPEEE